MRASLHGKSLSHLRELHNKLTDRFFRVASRDNDRAAQYWAVMVEIERLIATKEQRDMFYDAALEQRQRAREERELRQQRAIANKYRPNRAIAIAFHRAAKRGG